MSVCSQCKHLMPEGETWHICPSPEYTQDRDALVHSAAIAEEESTQEDLERAMWATTTPEVG